MKSKLSNATCDINDFRNDGFSACQYQQQTGACTPKPEDCNEISDICGFTANGC
jgi:hypothetical protein